MGKSMGPKMKQPSQPSMKLQLKQQMKKGAIPNDMGLLPDTFIMPVWSKRPSLVSMLRERLQLERFRVFQRLKDFLAFGLYYYKSPKPRPNHRLWKTKWVAKALQTQAYTAFAEGDIAVLKKVCNDGILASFRARLAERPSGQRLQWTLHKYTSTPRVVCHRAGMVPGMPGVGIRQAVVRIKSQQSLTRLSQTSTQETQPLVEEKTEYVVVQTRMWNGQEEGWMFWGTVEESDWKKALE